MRRRNVRRPRVGTMIAALAFAAVLTAVDAVLVAGAGAQTTPVTVTVTSSLNPSTYGQSVTFKASVSSIGGLLGQGTVQFQIDGANAGGAEAVALGSASYTTSGLGGGNHSVTANYTSTNGNGSGTVAQVVNKAGTALKLSSSANPAPAGGSVVLTATISVNGPGGGSPSGTVAFVAGNTALGSVNASQGQAYLTVSPGMLPGGTSSITAAYAGNSDFNGSSSSLSQTISGTGAQPTPSPKPTPSKTPSPKPTPSKTPTPTKTPTPSPTPSPSFLVAPTPSYTFATTYPTAFPVAVSPSPKASAASKNSKLPLVALIVLIVVIIGAAVVVSLRRRRLGV